MSTTLDEWIEAVKLDRRDAERWRKLMRLCGDLQDGSQTTVCLYQDDATMTPIIKVGTRSYYAERGSFGQVIDEIEESAPYDPWQT